MENFSVLLSIYYKEKPTFFEEALLSIWDKQTLKPNQIVVVKDGPLTENLENVIIRWKEKLGEILTIVPLRENLGLAKALNKGLKYCKYDLIARMDTDDISVLDRFEKQVTFMQENLDISVSSGLIEEWAQDLSYKISERRLPLNHESIVSFAKSRCPVSHPAVIYRKRSVIESGGYPLIYPEDYPLWGIMLNKGFKFANLPDVLVKMRVGDALSERRSKDFLKGEILTFNLFYSIGFLNRYQLYRNIMQRKVVRLSPHWLKKILYKYLRS